MTARGASCEELGPFRPHWPPDGPESDPARAGPARRLGFDARKPRRCKGQRIDEGVNETQRIVGLDVIAPAAGNNRSRSRSESDDVSHAQF